MLNERTNYGIKSLVHVCLTCTQQHLLDLRLLRQVEFLLAVVLCGVQMVLATALPDWEAKLQCDLLLYQGKDFQQLKGT